MLPIKPLKVILTILIALFIVLTVYYVDNIIGIKPLQSIAAGILIFSSLWFIKELWTNHNKF